MENTEIRRGDFVYKDTLFVDLGANKRHPRASTTDLRDLLLPTRGSTPKDQVAHWYEAQLLHYGLPRSKDKNTAKVRLTSALSAKALSVPRDIAQMEAEIKRDFASALRKAKNAATATTAKEKKVGASRGGGGSKTTIELEVDGVKLKIDRDVLDAAKKKSPSAKSKDASASGGASSKRPKGAQTSSSTPKPAPAAPPKSRAKAPTKSTTTPQGAAPPPRTLQTARRSQPFPRNTSARPVADPPSHVYDHTPVSFHHDVEMDDAPPAYESLGFGGPDEHTPNDDSGVVQISGTYFIPTKPFFPFDVTLQIDRRQQTLWGRFSVGSKLGVLRADDISRITTGDSVSFGWRSEDEDDGTMRFGRGCDGYMAFDGEGWVQGRFRGLMHGEDVDFRTIGQ